MERPRFQIDFNEVVDFDRNNPDDHGHYICLSQKDVRVDTNGLEHHLFEGMEIQVFDENYEQNAEGKTVRDDLLADGIVHRYYSTGHRNHVRWVFRVGTGGLYLESDRTLDRNGSL